MLCEKCHENEVSFIVSISSEPIAKEFRICEECASNNTGYEISETDSGTVEAGRECPNCGSRYLQSSLLGCPVCYREFHEELGPVINRIHGSTAYIKETNRAKQRADTEQKAGRLRSIYSAPSADAGWMQQNGPDSDVIISTRVRLARNISGYGFPGSLDSPKLSQVAEVLEKAISEISGNSELALDNSYIIDLGRLNNTDRRLLVERYLISKELVGKTGRNGSFASRREETPFRVIINKDEIISIMINEEDHIRLQVINSGLQLEESWKAIKTIDDSLGRRLQYAFSDDWGYLTACPTNVGTGLRASVMLHIPALTATKQGNKILSSMANMGYAIRGIYGEGTDTIGSFYQISNEFTLGQSGREIVERIQSVALQIVSLEREERNNLIEKERIETEDKIFRAFGILMNARLVSSREALELLSWISLGYNLGLLQNSGNEDKITGTEVSKNKIPQLLVLIRPAHLQRYAGRQLKPLERDLARATLIRAILNA